MHQTHWNKLSFQPIPRSSWHSLHQLISSLKHIYLGFFGIFSSWSQLEFDGGAREILRIAIVIKSNCILLLYIGVLYSLFGNVLNIVFFSLLSQLSTPMTGSIDGVVWWTSVTYIVMTSFASVPSEETRLSPGRTRQSFPCVVRLGVSSSFFETWNIIRIPCTPKLTLLQISRSASRSIWNQRIFIFCSFNFS